MQKKLFSLFVLGFVFVSKALCWPQVVIVYTQLLLFFARKLSVKFCCLPNLAVTSLVVCQGFVRNFCKTLLRASLLLWISSCLSTQNALSNSDSNLFFSCRSKSFHVLALYSFSVMNMHLLFAFFFSALVAVVAYYSFVSSVALSTKSVVKVAS